MSNLDVIRELSRLEADALLQLFVLDATDLGGSVLLFYSGTDTLHAPITWQGLDYQPIPCEAKGFAFTGEGAPPRPTIVFGNVGGAFSSLVLQFADLVGAGFVRKRVFAKHLDGMPDADPTKYLPDDRFTIERKVNETKVAVEFELGTNLDIEDTAVPQRVIYSNLCGFQYRGEGCGFASNTCRGDVFDNVAPKYTGQTFPVDAGPVLQNYRGAWSAADTYLLNDVVYIVTAKGLRVYFWCVNDNGGAGISGPGFSTASATYWTRDECSRRLRGCELRFKNDQTGLPFGGFPATARLS